MNIKDRLRNSIIKKVRNLSEDKLVEVNSIIDKIESQIKSKEKTMQFAGAWKDLDEGLFLELTTNLHDTRANDRQIN